jgi:[ribosomal protein S5]-alanine N-acetyltransferase
MKSARLRYRRVEPAELDAFHRLVQDSHVRRYLMDGNVFPREWSAERIDDSQALFARRNVGLWLVDESATGALIGFCGFLELPSVHPEPQLVYALLEAFTGRGYATEMGHTAITHARMEAGFSDIIGAVDEPNVASIRVLEKLGFEVTGHAPGPFGRTVLFRLSA